MSIKITDVAKAFLTKESMSHKKLQKLCYYAQCWNYYFNNNEDLTDENFEAWVHGPVCPALYTEYKEYGYNQIPKITSFQLDEKYQEVIDSVYEAYGRYDGNQLEGITHSETPWIKARNGKKPYEASTDTISKKDMYEYCVKTMNQSQIDV